MLLLSTVGYGYFYFVRLINRDCSLDDWQIFLMWKVKLTSFKPEIEVTFSLYAGVFTIIRDLKIVHVQPSTYTHT